jgi:nitroreductase
MNDNPIIQTMLDRKSIRKFTDRRPSDAVITSLVRAGQQAPFASQLCSLLLSRDRERNPFNAPLLFTLCVDAHKLEIIMRRRNWENVASDLHLLLMGLQDASLVGENMVIAAESLGMGSCFLGNAPYRAEKIIREYNLPPRVFPVVQLAMGYPAEDPPPRPRFPIEFMLFEDRYPDFEESVIMDAMTVMDEGYRDQDYYSSRKAMIPLLGDRKEEFTYENYSWTEHISRKWGQKRVFPEDLYEQLRICGFIIGEETSNHE